MSQIDYNKPLQYTKDEKTWHDVDWHRVMKDGAVIVEYDGGLWTYVVPHCSNHLRNKPETE